MRFHIDLIFEYPSPAVLQHVEFIERNQYLICLLSSFKANTLLLSIPNNIFNSLYSYLYHQRTCIHRLHTNILHFRMQTISQFYGKWFRREKKSKSWILFELPFESHWKWSAAVCKTFQRQWHLFIRTGEFASIRPTTKYCHSVWDMIDVVAQEDLKIGESMEMAFIRNYRRHPPLT